MIRRAVNWVRIHFQRCVHHSSARAHHVHTLTDVLDRRSLVHRYFRRSVQAAGGRYLHIPTGKAQQRPALGGSAMGAAAPGGISITRTDRASTASVLSAQGAQASAWGHPDGRVPACRCCLPARRRRPLRCLRAGQRVARVRRCTRRRRQRSLRPRCARERRRFSPRHRHRAGCRRHGARECDAVAAAAGSHEADGDVKSRQRVVCVRRRELCSLRRMPCAALCRARAARVRPVGARIKQTR